jgi:hypothetical protein
MTTPLDELVIKIVLNGREFEGQLKQADQGVKKFAEQASQSATVAERGAQKMVDGFSRVTKEILGVGAAILGVNGLKDLAVNLTTVAAAAGRMAEAFEIDPEMLNKWQGFLQAVGNQDFGTTAASLGALSKAVQEFRLTQKGPLLEAIPWLGRLGVSPADIMTGTVSQAVNSMLLKIGANINRPENIGVRTELLSHLPGATPTLMRGLERAPTQAVLDKYLTATAEQMRAASHMMEAITELAQALTRKLNTLLPDAEKPVVSMAKKLEKGDISGALSEGNLLAGAASARGRGQVEQAISDQFQKGSWLDNFLMIGGGHHDPDSAPSRGFRHSPGARGTGGVTVHVLDTSAMPQTARSSDGHLRRGGGNTINFTTNMHGVKTNNPQAWADAWADRVGSVFPTLAPQINGGGQ